MKDNLLQIVVGQEFEARENVYQFISERIFPKDNSKLSSLKQALYEREEHGNIQVDEGVVLPHIEDELITQTGLLIIKPKFPIKQWNSQIENIELVICLLLSPQETDKIRREIAAFMRKIADEDFLRELRASSDIKQINNILY